MQTASLFSPSNLGFVRVAVISPELRVADVAFNTQAIIAAMAEAAGQGCRLAVFPELGLTGYSCADLFYQRTLLEAAAAALDEIALEAQRGRDRRRRRAAAGGGRQALQLRGADRRTGGCWASCPRPSCPPPTSSTRNAGSRRAAWRSGRDGRDQRAGGAVWRATCSLRPTTCRTA